MEKGPKPYHRATPRDPQTFTREVAERVAEEMTRDTGIKHIAQPWKQIGSEIAYIIGRKISPEEAANGQA